MESATSNSNVRWKCIKTVSSNICCDFCLHGKHYRHVCLVLNMGTEVCRCIQTVSSIQEITQNYHWTSRCFYPFVIEFRLITALLCLVPIVWSLLYCIKCIHFICSGASSRTQSCFVSVKLTRVPADFLNWQQTYWMTFLNRCTYNRSQPIVYIDICIRLYRCETL